MKFITFPKRRQTRDTNFNPFGEHFWLYIGYFFFLLGGSFNTITNSINLYKNIDGLYQICYYQNILIIGFNLYILSVFLFNKFKKKKDPELDSSSFNFLALTLENKHLTKYILVNIALLLCPILFLNYGEKFTSVAIAGIIGYLAFNAFVYISMFKFFSKIDKERRKL